MTRGDCHIQHFIERTCAILAGLRLNHIHEFRLPLQHHVMQPQHHRLPVLKRRRHPLFLGIACGSKRFAGEIGGVRGDITNMLASGGGINRNDVT